jgi:hypothetical protein
MIDLLKQYGFTYRGTCNCAGPRTEKWKYAEFTLYWNKKSKMFRLKKFGKPVTTLQPEDKAEETIKKFILNVQAA